MINLLLLKLKFVGLALVFAIMGLLLFSFSTSRQAADDIWKQLGMTREQGIDGMKQSFLNGYLYYYGARNAKNIAVNDRAAIARDLLTYTRQYVSSPFFKKEYEKLRTDAKPEPPTETVPTKEEIRKEKIAETEKSIRKTEDAMKISADMAKIMKPTLELLKKTLADYKDPASKNIEAYYMYEKNEQASRVRSYNDRLARWDKDYPADFREKIKLRVQKLLEL